MTDDIKRAGALARFREGVTAAGLSMADVAEILGVSSATMSRMLSLSHTASPNSRQIMDICEAADISPTWLLFGFGAKNLSTVRRVAEAMTPESVFMSYVELLAGVDGALVRLEKVAGLIDSEDN